MVCCSDNENSIVLKRRIIFVMCILFRQNLQILKWQNIRERVSLMITVIMLSAALNEKFRCIVSSACLFSIPTAGNIAIIIALLSVFRGIK